VEGSEGLQRAVDDVSGVLGSAVTRHDVSLPSAVGEWWVVVHVVVLRFRTVAKCDLCGKRKRRQAACRCTWPK
jgi:hypothetical protein